MSEPNEETKTIDFENTNEGEDNIGNTEEVNPTADIKEGEGNLGNTEEVNPTADIKEGEGNPVDIKEEKTNYITGENPQLNAASGSEIQVLNKEQSIKISNLLSHSASELNTLSIMMKTGNLSIADISERLLATAAKLTDENPFKGGKSKRKAYKNKKKNKTKKGGRKSKKNQKNKR